MSLNNMDQSNDLLKVMKQVNISLKEDGSNLETFAFKHEQYARALGYLKHFSVNMMTDDGEQVIVNAIEDRQYSKYIATLKNARDDQDVLESRLGTPSYVPINITHPISEDERKRINRETNKLLERRKDAIKTQK